MFAGMGGTRQRQRQRGGGTFRDGGGRVRRGLFEVLDNHITK